MDDRATELIRMLDLHPHVEGGHYREVFRSTDMVLPADERSSRSALTSIYFLLTAGNASRWHLVRSDELWHYYEGDPLTLLTIDPESFALRRHVLGPIGAAQEPVLAVRAGEWQAALTQGAYTLVGATVGPGFEYPDFALMREDAIAADRVRQMHPEAANLL